MSQVTQNGGNPSDWGVKISLPGFDATTATPEQCVVHSAYAAPLVDATATPGHFGQVLITFNNDPSDGVDTIVYQVAHGYKYVPFALASGINTYSGGSTLTGTLPITPTATFSLWTRTDATNFYIYVHREAGYGTIVGSTLLATWFIFAGNGLFT